MRVKTMRFVTILIGWGISMVCTVQFFSTAVEPWYWSAGALAGAGITLIAGLQKYDFKLSNFAFTVTAIIGVFYCGAALIKLGSSLNNGKSMLFYGGMMLIMALIVGATAMAAAKHPLQPPF